MSVLENDDNFQCCLHLIDEPEKILIGTTNGYIYLGSLIKFEEITTFEFKNSNMAIVLKEIQLILKIKGIVRSIEYLDDENILILSNEGEIVNYNRKNNDYYYIQEYIGTQYNRPWRLLILDENSFITIGNYRKIIYWYKEEAVFKSKLIESGGYPLFCIDWIDREDNKFLINGNDGYTSIWEYSGSPKVISVFTSNKNLQKCLLTNNGLIISVDYFGTFHIYREKENTLENIEEYDISISQGNWVQFSEEIKKVLIGTNDCIILCSENLDNLWKLDIECKQILNFNNIDLILTSKTIVRPNYSKKREFVDFQDYKFIKLGLVGDSRVGKTCFCKYLETEEYDPDTKSSFGKHVWTIKLKDNKRLLYYDLAGQTSELYTYFPIIKDSEIILLFFNGLLKDTFMKVIDYFQELRENCKQDTQFFFIQTYSSEDPERLIKDWIIRKEFDKYGLDFDNNLVKVDSYDGLGFDEYKRKVIDNINWDVTTPVYKSKIYDNVENVLNSLYNLGEENISLIKLQEMVRLNIRLLEYIILKFKNQGKVEYIEEEREILLNDIVYERTLSLLSEKIDGNDGFIPVKKILECLGNDSARLKYIKAILEYYRENQICIFFKEGINDEEIVIAERKLKDNLEISSQLIIPKSHTNLFYINKIIKLDQLIHFLSEYPLNIISISKSEILLENSISSAILKISINIEQIINDRNVRVCSIHLQKDTEEDYVFEKALLIFFLDKLDHNLVDFSYVDSRYKETNFQSLEEELKFILKNPYENQFIDFKADINISDDKDKAELMKDIIALTNSSFINHNLSYLILGIEESQFKIDKLVHVDNVDKVEQTITQISSNHLDGGPHFHIQPMLIRDLYLWQKNGEISSIIPFNQNQKHPNCEEEILFIKMERNPNTICEISKEFHFIKKKKDFYRRVGASWFRISSHTFRLRDFHRVMIRNKYSS